jgi:hypothetical protein
VSADKPRTGESNEPLAAHAIGLSSSVSSGLNLP